MINTLQEAKSALRRQVLAELRALPQAERTAASEQACARLAQQPLWQEARTILGYAPMPGELDIWPLLVAAAQAGKVVCLPRYVATADTYEACRVPRWSEDLLRGRLGILEPAAHCDPHPLNQLDFILVPGVAFDANGCRLGRGKGYYDRLLASAAGTKCGVAFDQQVKDQVPVGPQDIQLDCILTPTRWLIAGRGRF